MHQKNSMTKAAPYELLGRPESGYSLKVRSALRYKAIEYKWVDRFSHEKLFQANAKVQLMPLVLLPNGSSMQDSTPILEHLEQAFPDPSFHPEDSALRFLSELLEEYGDEWGNKLMFQYRWGYLPDQKRRSKTLATGIIGGRIHPLVGKWLGPLLAPLVVKRMVPRMALAGANKNNKPLLVDSFDTLVTLLNTHLQERSYIFGERPAFGDFGVWGQLHQAYTDPSCCDILNTKGSAVVQWIERMLKPENLGNFETLDALRPTLAPLFSREVAPRFLAWDAANAKAWTAGEQKTELTMDGQVYYQKTFKYPAYTFGLLREKYDHAKHDEALTRFLEETDCLRYLV